MTKAEWFSIHRHGGKALLAAMLPEAASALVYEMEKQH